MSLTIGFAVIASLLLWVIIGSKGHWATKAFVIAVALYFCLSVGVSIRGFKGWPTDEPLPDEFHVHWVVIQEPDRKTGFGGAIFAWVHPLKERKKPSGWTDYLVLLRGNSSEPRAYKLPYTRKLHEKAQEALGMIMGGQQVVGLKGSGKGEVGSGEDPSGREGGEGQQGGEGGGSLTEGGDISFHRLPPPVLPEKGAP